MNWRWCWRAKEIHLIRSVSICRQISATWHSLWSAMQCQNQLILLSCMLAGSVTPSADPPAIFAPGVIDQGQDNDYSFASLGAIKSSSALERSADDTSSTTMEVRLFLSLQDLWDEQSWSLLSWTKLIIEFTQVQRSPVSHNADRICFVDMGYQRDEIYHSPFKIFSRYPSCSWWPCRLFSRNSQRKGLAHWVLY